jgi:hypothetical protein
MNTLYAAGAAAILSALYAAPAAAQQPPAAQQWCAIDSEAGDNASCIYSSLPQCLQAFNPSGICYQDSSYQAVPTTIARPRKARARNS